MGAFDSAWATEVCARCDAVFAAADVGFVRQVQAGAERPDRVRAILWEADPARFAAKYPDSGVVESYGPEWDGVGCIDYWLDVDAAEGLLRLGTEGWNLPEILLSASGQGGMDGMQAAAVFARILAVRWPLPEQVPDRARR